MRYNSSQVNKSYSRAPKKRIVAQVAKKFLVYLELKLYYRVHKRLPPTSILGQMNGIHTVLTISTRQVILNNPLNFVTLCNTS
jgi:hypothetical protein